MPLTSNWLARSARNSKARAGVARQDILVTIRDCHANSRYSVPNFLKEEDHVFSCQSLMRSHHPVRTCNADIAGLCSKRRAVAASRAKSLRGGHAGKYEDLAAQRSEYVSNEEAGQAGSE